MKLLADLHTHSKNSRFGHGKNSIEEMAIEANEIGLVEIGVTDHGYSHFFRTSKQKIKQARQKVDEINSWSKTKVLLGVEADIINENGDIDIDNETLSMLDILIVGYHKMIFTDFANFFGKTKKTEEAKLKCTNAFVNAINKYPVTIVAHLDSILTTDLYKIGKACKERGTMVEINNRHTKWNQKQVDDLLASDCMFVLSSDAHSRENVGEVSKAKEFIKKYNIPSEKIVNVEFADSEKSRKDLEYSAYMSIYEKIAKEKRDRGEIVDSKTNDEHPKLSNEMEEALRKIAAEQGIDYSTEKKDKPNEVIGGLFEEEEARLIAMAEEYIKNHKLDNIDAENDSINSVDGDKELDEYKFNDDHPLLKNNDSFEDRFQPLSDIAGRLEKFDATTNYDNLKKLEGIEFDPNEKPRSINAKQQPVVKIIEQPQVVEPEMELQPKTEQDKSSLNVFEQMNTSSNMADLKKMMAESIAQNEEEKPVSQPKQEVEFQKVAPENFMDSITQTRLASGAKKEEPVPEKKIQQKPVAEKKTNRRGAFIVVDNLLDEQKK